MIEMKYTLLFVNWKSDKFSIPQLYGLWKRLQPDSYNFCSVRSMYDILIYLPVIKGNLTNVVLKYYI